MKIFQHRISHALILVKSTLLQSTLHHTVRRNKRQKIKKLTVHFRVTFSNRVFGGICDIYEWESRHTRQMERNKVIYVHVRTLTAFLLKRCSHSCQIISAMAATIITIDWTLEGKKKSNHKVEKLYTEPALRINIHV